MYISMGIDPGSQITGYGLVAMKGSSYVLVAAGEIKTKRGLPLPQRLDQIYQGLQDVLLQYSPQEVAVEDIFYAKNVQSALKLGHARGVALLAAASAGLPVYEYPATTIKKSVAGFGQAGKDQINLMVKRLLNVNDDFSPDTSDALAAAICHLNHVPGIRLREKAK